MTFTTDGAFGFPAATRRHRHDFYALPAVALDAYQCETARIVLDSLAPATRRAYRIALAAISDWHDGRVPSDASMATPYVGT